MHLIAGYLYKPEFFDAEAGFQADIDIHDAVKRGIKRDGLVDKGALAAGGGDGSAAKDDLIAVFVFREDIKTGG